MRARRVARQLWRGAALASVGLAGAAAFVTARHLLATPQPLASGLPGEGRLDRRHGGEVYYTVAGPVDARPVVLLHDFYPGASSFEFRAVFTRLAQTYRVYAPDWLGFGLSERPALTHTGEFYAAMLSGFLRDVVGAPATVIAHGLAGNIATRAASDTPQVFERLLLVAPAANVGLRLDPTPSQTLTRLMQKLALGLTPYAVVSLRPALRLAAGRRSAAGPLDVDAETLDHLYASAHQFGGQYAALSLFTGELDLPIRQIFPTLRTPTLIMVGARDSRHSLAEMERLVALHPQADLEVISNAGETVYLDQPTLFMHTLHRWMSRRIASHGHERPVAAPQLTTPATSATTAAPPLASPPASIAAAPSEAAPESPDADAASGAAVKIVPVLEPVASDAPSADSSGDAPSAQAQAQVYQELEVSRTPDGEAMEHGPTPTDFAQPLTLEPTAEEGSSAATGPTMRHGGPDLSRGRQAPGPRSTQSATARGGAYLYAPEMRTHVLRASRAGGQNGPHSTRGRHVR